MEKAKSASFRDCFHIQGMVVCVPESDARIPPTGPIRAFPLASAKRRKRSPENQARHFTPRSRHRVIPLACKGLGGASVAGSAFSHAIAESPGRLASLSTSLGRNQSRNAHRPSEGYPMHETH